MHPAGAAGSPWVLGFHDPGPWAWFVVAIDFTAAFCAFRAAGRDPGGASFWRCAAAIMALVAINKQLDLQALLTDVARQMAYAQHWYELRRLVQAIFIGTLAMTGAVVLAMVARSARRWPRPRQLAFSGLFLLALFVLIRAASFHHVDVMLTQSATTIAIAKTFESGSAVVIALAALAAGERRHGRA
jgi:hypothetical protein